MVRRGIIDFSAFLSKDYNVIIKELSVCDIDSLSTQHWMFKPPQNQPHSIQCEYTDRTPEYRNQWMTTHYHGLYYTNGDTHYESLASILSKTCHDIQVLFAPTTEKAKVLEEIFNYERVVVSLELMGCPPLPTEPLLDIKSNDRVKTNCLFHEIYAQGFYCTQNAVHSLAAWCNSNSDKIDLTKTENRLKTFASWNLAIPSAQQLAEQGFILHSRTEDSTKCIYCGIVLHQWRIEDIPAEDHEAASPFCRFVRYLAQCRSDEEQQRRKKSTKPTEDRGEDVCGCFDLPKITEKELNNLCYT